MTLDEITIYLAELVRIPDQRKTKLELFASITGIVDICDRYDKAREELKERLYADHHQFSIRDLMYLELRLIEEECKLTADYDRKYPKNRDFPIQHQPNNLARRFITDHIYENFEEIDDIEEILFEVLDITYDRLRKDHPWVVRFLEFTRLSYVVGPKDSKDYVDE